MGRPKGSINKKIEPVKSEFTEELNIEESTEVHMTAEMLLEDIEKDIDAARLELEKTRREIESNKEALKLIPVVKDAPAVAIEGKGLSEKILEQKKRDNELVTGKFYNLRAKGQSKKLPYHKYGDDPVKWWTFDHGATYTIPRGFADQINDHYYTPHFIKNEGQIIDPTNPESGIHAVDTTDKMYSFVPLNF